MRCSLFTSAVLFALAIALPLAAQNPTPTPSPGVAPGERIRVNATGLKPPVETKYGSEEPGPTTETGTVQRATNDTITFRPDAKGPDTLQLTEVPVAHIERLDISKGIHGNTVPGLAWGAGIGAVTGLALGAAGCSGRDEFFTEGQCIAVLTPVLAVGGLAIGALVGTLIKTEKWVRVPGYPVAKVSVVPLPRGAIGYGLALNF